MKSSVSLCLKVRLWLQYIENKGITAVIMNDTQSKRSHRYLTGFDTGTPCPTHRPTSIQQVPLMRRRPRLLFGGPLEINHSLGLPRSTCPPYTAAAAPSGMIWQVQRCGFIAREVVASAQWRIPSR